MATVTRAPVVVRLQWLRLLLVIVAIGGVSPTYAQVLNAQIQGVVRSAETGEGLAGVTVAVQSPALPDLQAEITDAKGRYLITALPPGDDYVVNFYFGPSDKPLLVRSGIRLSAAKTVAVDARLSTTAQTQRVQVIRETAPNVDVANANTGVEINQEMLRQIPLRGRSFQGALFLAPGASDVAARNFNTVEGSFATPGGDVGVSISGSTGSENAYLIDGINTTDPGLGVVGAEVSQYFLREINVLTGGYQAEYGRATGGIVSLVTKNGSNELHGGVYGSVAPYQLSGQGVARLGEALVRRTRPDMGTWDLGFDLGGALIKDRIWFYAGLAITNVNVRTERRGRAQIFNGTGALDLVDFACPSYLSDSRYCDGPSKLAKQTEELDYVQTQAQTRAIYNGIAKLQFHLATDQDLFLSYIGSPNTRDTYYEYGTGDEGSRFTESNQVHDLSLRYQGKTFGKKLQIDLTYAMHYQTQVQQPRLPNLPFTAYTADAADPYSLADFESVAACRRDAASGFNPCPITRYVVGLGFHRSQELQRHQALAGFTLFVNALGVHAIKAGLDFEYLRSNLTSIATGQDGFRATYNSTADGTDIFSGFGLGGKVNGVDTPLNSLNTVTATRNYAVYLRDSWSVASTGLTLNIGGRWEGLQMIDVNGDARLSVLDNFAPRVGAVWDFTRLTKRPGRGKLFVNYGRFYESVGTDLGDRAFGGQAFYFRAAGMAPAACPQVSRQPGGRPLPTPGPGCSFDTQLLFGGNPYDVVPGAKPSSIDEVTAGLSYDVGYDIVLSASYIYRGLSNVLEDFSTDGGATYFIGTPGLAPDAATLQAATDEAARLNAIAMAPSATQADQDAAAKAQTRLDALSGIGNYPRATRNYHAMVLSVSKRLSKRFSFLASYTFSSTSGNYPGTFNSTNGQLNPHTSTQFDFPELLLNRDGPLPTDRPHNFKLSGFYQQPIGDKGVLTGSLTFTAISGRPIEVLGAHPAYGPSEVFILPRGSGGRTPTVTQTDLHIGYDHLLTEKERLGVFVDLVNLFNQREITNVDDNYTYSPVKALVDESAQKKFQVETVDGSPVIANSNYGQATAYQAPLYFRLGARLTF